jgi:hypothetical protein
MHRRLGVICAAGLLLAVLAPAAVAAQGPQAVTIDSTMTINYPDPNSGTFTRTSGSDLICETGSVLDTRYVPADLSDLRNHLLVDKTFDCGDGQVYLRLQVHFAGGDETFTWTVLGGTGTYARLRGQGDGTTEPIEGGVINHYTGFLVG